MLLNDRMDSNACYGANLIHCALHMVQRYELHSTQSCSLVDAVVGVSGIYEKHYFFNSLITALEGLAVATYYQILAISPDLFRSPRWFAIERALTSGQLVRLCDTNREPCLLDSGIPGQATNPNPY